MLAAQIFVSVPAHRIRVDMTPDPSRPAEDAAAMARRIEVVLARLKEARAAYAASGVSGSDGIAP